MDTLTKRNGQIRDGKKSWVSLLKLVWIEVLVILKSGKIVRNARDTDLEMFSVTHKNASQTTQEILLNFLSTYGKDVILPGLIIHNSALT